MEEVDKDRTIQLAALEESERERERYQRLMDNIREDLSGVYCQDRLLMHFGWIAKLVADYRRGIITDGKKFSTAVLVSTYKIINEAMFYGQNSIEELLLEEKKALDKKLSPVVNS